VRSPETKGDGVDRTTSTIVLLVALTTVFAIDLWFTRILGHMLGRLIEHLPAMLPKRGRYRAQSMPDAYERLRKPRKGS